MANVLFKQGLQANLDVIRSNKTAVEGAFYLTTDTHRLYIGKGGDAIPVNEGITTVDHLDKLPPATVANAGQFYYISGDSNILAVSNGSTWVQLNPDTNTYVSNVKVDVTTNDKGVANIKTTVTNTGVGNAPGTGDKTTEFTIQGANGIAVSNVGTAITVTGDTYELSQKTTDGSGYGDGSVTLTVASDSVEANTSSATLKAGTNVKISKDSDGNTVIESKNTKLTGSSVTAAFGNGSTTSASNNGFYVSVVDSDGTGNKATLDPVVQLGDHDDVSYHFESGVATLPVYTKDEIDTRFHDLNGVTYKGTVGTGGSVATLPTSDVKIGDMYLVVGNEALTIAGATTAGTGGTVGQALKGDLVIAKGTEVNGVLPSNGITWDIIPAGDDAIVDTTYSGTGINGGIKITAKGGTDIARITVKGDSYLTVTDKIAGGFNDLTLTHNLVTKNDTTAEAVTQAAGGDLEITAVVGVTRDAAGHVSGIETKKFTVKDTYAAVASVYHDAAVATADGVTTATVSTFVETQTASGNVTKKSGDFKVKSSSLTVTATAATKSTAAGVTTANAAPEITVELTWGEF